MIYFNYNKLLKGIGLLVVTVIGGFLVFFILSSVGWLFAHILRMTNMPYHTMYSILNSPVSTDPLGGMAVLAITALGLFCVFILSGIAMGIKSLFTRDEKNNDGKKS